jgi:tetratricopeptide (TPR) repeat protein
MGVDARRDHRFNVPKPQLTDAFQVPNACQDCHDDQSAQWVAKQIDKHHTRKTPLTQSQKNWIKLQHQGYLDAADHLALINDQSLADIKHASAITLLPYSLSQLTDADIKNWVLSPSPLIRLAIAQTGFMLSAQDKQQHFLSLLTDEYKAIRVAAAEQLVALALDSTEYHTAFKELMHSYQVNSWRGEGGLNKSIVYTKQHQFKAAIGALEQAIKVDTYFDAPYINLADLYRQTGEHNQAQQVLLSGLKQVPKSAILHYSRAMQLIRKKQYAEAISALEDSVRFDADNPQYAFALYIALDNTGNTQQALARLLTDLAQYRFNPQLVQLGIQYARKTGNKQALDKLMQPNE